MFCCCCCLVVVVVVLVSGGGVFPTKAALFRFLEFNHLEGTNQACRSDTSLSADRFCRANEIRYLIGVGK